MRAAKEIDRGLANSPYSLAGAANLLADYPAQRSFERFSGTTDVIAQSVVDQALVVAATGFLNLITEPIDYIVIEANGDPRLPLGYRHHRAALRL